MRLAAQRFCFGVAVRINRVWIFLYGKKHKAVVPLITGIALCVVPYFIADVYVLVLVGVILMVIPYFVRI